MSKSSSGGERPSWPRLTSTHAALCTRFVCPFRSTQRFGGGGGRGGGGGVGAILGVIQQYALSCPCPLEFWAALSEPFMRSTAEVHFFRSRILLFWGALWSPVSHTFSILRVVCSREPRGAEEAHSGRAQTVAYMAHTLPLDLLMQYIKNVKTASEGCVTDE